MSMEEWKDIAGYEGLYKISNHGRVMRGEGRILKPYSRDGYHLSIGLWKNNCREQPHVHGLVAQAFIGPRPDGLMVNHIDGDPQNNHCSNLEYVTNQENVLHAYRIGLYDKTLAEGERQEIYRRIAQGEKKIRIVEEYKISWKMLYRILKAI